jgi:hypothetical protein
MTRVGHAATPEMLVKAALAPRSDAADVVLALESLGIQRAEAEHWAAEAVTHVGRAGSDEALVAEAVRLRHASRSAGRKPAPRAVRERHAPYHRQALCTAWRRPVELRPWAYGGATVSGEAVGLG